MAEAVGIQGAHIGGRAMADLERRTAAAPKTISPDGFEVSATARTSAHPERIQGTVRRPAVHDLRESFTAIDAPGPNRPPGGRNRYERWGVGLPCGFRSNLPVVRRLGCFAAQKVLAHAENSLNRPGCSGTLSAVVSAKADQQNDSAQSPSAFADSAARVSVDSGRWSRAARVEVVVSHRAAWAGV